MSKQVARCKKCREEFIVTFYTAQYGMCVECSKALESE